MTCPGSSKPALDMLSSDLKERRCFQRGSVQPGRGDGRKNFGKRDRCSLFFGNPNGREDDTGRTKMTVFGACCSKSCGCPSHSGRYGRATHSPGLSRTTATHIFYCHLSSFPGARRGSNLWDGFRPPLAYNLVFFKHRDYSCNRFRFIWMDFLPACE